MTDKQFRAWLENKLRGIAFVTRGATKPLPIRKIAVRLNQLNDTVKSFAYKHPDA